MTESCFVFDATARCTESGRKEICSGKCKELDTNLLRIDEFVMHSGTSVAATAQYMLQQIRIKFKTNKDIDEDGDGMREWVSPMDSGDQRLFFRSLFDSKVKMMPQS